MIYLHAKLLINFKFVFPVNLLPTHIIQTIAADDYNIHIFHSKKSSPKIPIGVSYKYTEKKNTHTHKKTTSTNKVNTAL